MYRRGPWRAKQCVPPHMGDGWCGSAIRCDEPCKHGPGHMVLRLSLSLLVSAGFCSRSILSNGAFHFSNFEFPKIKVGTSCGNLQHLGVRGYCCCFYRKLDYLVSRKHFSYMCDDILYCLDLQIMLLIGWIKISNWKCSVDMAYWVLEKLHNSKFVQ